MGCGVSLKEIVTEERVLIAKTQLSSQREHELIYFGVKYDLNWEHRLRLPQMLCTDMAIVS